MKQQWRALAVVSVMVLLYLWMLSGSPHARLPQSIYIPKSPVVVAVGDIACPPERITDQWHCRQADIATLTEAQDPAAVLVLGDVQYESGDLANFKASYDKSWGRLNDIVRPVPGNHEYYTFNGIGYFDYFGAKAGEKFKGYYSFDINNWHIIALNSEIDVSSISAERRWLRADLAAHPNLCTLAYWHEARFSTGIHPSDPKYQGLWEDLYAAGADVVVNGHSHDYERFLPQTPDGHVDNERGIVQFVSGLGGKDFEIFTRTNPHVVTRQNMAFGILKFTLLNTGLRYDFMKLEDQPAYTDSGVVECHR